MKPTQEQVIAWAKQFKWVGFSSEFVSAVTLAYEAGCKDENEACAKLCENFAIDAFNNENQLYEQCAAAIRARGNHD